MSALPDALLLRDWGDNGPSSRIYNGVRYRAISVWANEPTAQEAARAIRAQGSLARVTREVRPRRARADLLKTTIYSDRPARRYMWVVWSAEKPACADNSDEEPA